MTCGGYEEVTLWSGMNLFRGDNLSGRTAIFSFLVQATAPDQSDKYVAGKRYELIVFVREYSMDDAKPVVRQAISRAGWQFPEIREAMQVDGKTKLTKLNNLNLEDALRTAAKHGCSIVAFDKPVT